MPRKGNHWHADFNKLDPLDQLALLGNDGGLLPSVLMQAFRSTSKTLAAEADSLPALVEYLRQKKP